MQRAEVKTHNKQFKGKFGKKKLKEIYNHQATSIKENPNYENIVQWQLFQNSSFLFLVDSEN